MLNKLPISIGILTWNSDAVLVKTLKTYSDNGLFDIVNDVHILFQNVNDRDIEIAKQFKLNFIGLNVNIGIGNGFVKLTKLAETDNILLLEHDWNLIENVDTTYDRLMSGLKLLNNGYDCIRYRHRLEPGYPLFSIRHKGNELTYYDDEIGCTSPHLLDSIHWTEPEVKFPDYIKKDGEYFTTTSRYGNWTNNPCLYKKNFYLKTVEPFTGNGVDLEGNISKWWSQQNFKVAHGEGLFKHNDWIKYGQ